MESLHKLTKPISKDTLKKLQQDPQKPLENLQGNILQGHGRDHSVHIFLRFNDEKRYSVKKWIKSLSKCITSAQRQLDEIEQYRQYRIPGRLFISFFLSASGYTSLGLNVPKDSAAIANQAFTYGMKAAQAVLNDPPKEKWDESYRQRIDAMLLLADDDETFLLREARKLLDRVKAHAYICTIERGKVMRNAQEYPVEHFGFVDGRSQPLFFESDIKWERQESDGTHVWPPDAGPDLVLVPDPHGEEKDSTGKVVHHHSGSYLVLRKLEQNVRAFKEHEKELAKALGLSGEEAKRVGALIMGRFEDGTPVILQDTAGRPNPVPNNFTYDDDPDGHKCPFQAHIRKVNRRIKGIRRIVRRGITYGTREKEPKDNPSLEELPTRGVGILFLCYQKNIGDQFEYLQREWASESNFPEEETGIDPVIGQPEQGKTSCQKWRAEWGNSREEPKSFAFHSFVTLKGGEYFFAPSIYFLKNIDKS
jgi:Dyp-type peroxidase family